MARLPRVGSDYNRWGEFLNAFLRVALNEDGSIKQSVVDAAVAAAIADDDTVVQAAAAAVDGELATRNLLEAIDEDDFASNADTKVPTQQSTKAYVDVGLSIKLDVSAVVDEDDFISDADDRIPTQQSVGAYIAFVRSIIENFAEASQHGETVDLRDRSVPAGGRWYQTLGKLGDADYATTWLDPDGMVLPIFVRAFDGTVEGYDAGAAHATTITGPDTFADGPLDGTQAVRLAAETSTVTIAIDAFPASLALRYCEDAGVWHHAYLTTPGAFGTRGQVTHSGSTLTIAAASGTIDLAGVRADTRELTDTERTQLEASDRWEWDDLPGVVRFDPRRTFSVIGDMHIGHSYEGAQPSIDTAYDDLLAMGSGWYTRRIYVGDLVDSSTGGKDDEALAFMIGLDGERWDAVAGNHDISSSRDADAWATEYGYASANWTRDLGFCRVIAIASDGPAPTSTLSSATLDYLETQLAANRKDTLILCHFPLFATAGQAINEDLSWAGSTTYGNPESDSLHVVPTADLFAILDAHPHARVWVCGHTHSPQEAPDIYTQKWVGSRHIAHINAGHIVDRGEGRDPRSLALTMQPNGLMIRVRNHAAAAWEPYVGSYVYALKDGVPPQAAAPRSNPAALVAPLNRDTVAMSAGGVTEVTYPGARTWATETGETGIVVPYNTYNNFHNPLFITGTHGAISGSGAATYARSTEWSYLGPASIKVSATGANSYVQRSRTIPSGETWITSWVVHNPGASARTFRITYDGSEIVAPTVVGAGQTVRLESDPITGTGSTSQFRVSCTDSVNGDIWYLGHTQLEPGSTVTGVIPQVDASGSPLPGYVLTPNDQATGFWYRSFVLAFDPSAWLDTDAGSLVIRARFTTSSGFNRIIHHNPGGNNRMYLERKAADNKMRMTVGEGLVADSHTVVNDTDVHTFGISWERGRAKLYVDGRLESISIGLHVVDTWGSDLHIAESGESVVYSVYAARRALSEQEHAWLHAHPTQWRWRSLG